MWFFSVELKSRLIFGVKFGGHFFFMVKGVEDLIFTGV